MGQPCSSTRALRVPVTQPSCPSLICVQDSSEEQLHPPETPSCPGSLLQEYEDRHPYLQLHSFPHVPAQLGTQPLAPADGVAGHKCLMKQSGVICLG